MPRSTGSLVAMTRLSASGNAAGGASNINLISLPLADPGDLNNQFGLTRPGPICRPGDQISFTNADAEPIYRLGRDY